MILVGENKASIDHISEEQANNKQTYILSEDDGNMKIIV